MALSMISAILLVSFSFVLMTSQTIATGMTTHMKMGSKMSSIGISFNCSTFPPPGRIHLLDGGMVEKVGPKESRYGCCYAFPEEPAGFGIDLGSAGIGEGDFITHADAGSG